MVKYKLLHQKEGRHVGVANENRISEWIARIKKTDKWVIRGTAKILN